MKLFFSASLCVIFSLANSFVLAQQEERLTITTYYPSPTGVYQRLQTQTLGVGDTNNSGGLDVNDAPDPTANPGNVWIRGNVGIGTTAPASKLHVVGPMVAGTPGYALKVEGQASTYQLESGTGTNTLRLGYDQGNNRGNIQAGTGTPGVDFAATNLILQSQGGMLGVGQASPSAKIDSTGTDTVGIRYVKTGSKDSRITVGDPTQNWSMAVGWNTAGDLSLIEEGAAGNRIYVERVTGEVGIGTSAPAQRLEVNGSIRLDPVAEPTSKAAGSMYYNSTRQQVMLANGTSFFPFPKIQSEQRVLTTGLLADAAYDFNVAFPRQNYFTVAPVIVANLEVWVPSWNMFWRINDPLQSSSPYMSIEFGFKQITTNGFILTVNFHNATQAKGWTGDWRVNYIAVES